MRYGDRDGFGTIYGSNGELILHQGEKVLVTEENVIPSLKSTWRYYGGEYLLEPSKGNVHLTSERLVFINIPERMFAIGGAAETRAMGSADGSSFGIGGLPSGGSQREYFEIPNIEIMASEKREGAVSVGQMVNVYVLSSGNQFHLSIVLNEESNLLNRLMNKRIKALDELVSNLKQFFQQTDWMYTEVERSMMSKGASLPPPMGAPQRSQERPSPETKGGPVPSEVGTRSPMRRMPKLGQEQLKYFEGLYGKGLITKDVYDRLVGEYAPSVQALQGPGERVQQARPPSAVEAPPAKKGDDPSDQDLLDILSGAMAGMPASDVPSAKEVPENSDTSADPAEKASVMETAAPAKKARKLIKLSVKG